MNRTVLIALLVGAVFLVSITLWENDDSSRRAPTAGSRSPYAAQEMRSIKSLSADDITALEAGKGDALGGLAKLAELNGYPGPRHVLDSAAQLGLTAEQKEAVERVYREMNEQARVLGRQLVEHERDLDSAFGQGSISHESLERRLAESARVYGELRKAHLRAHLTTKDILTADQVRHYNELRGYLGVQDPCRNVPPGHDPAMWRAHQGCPAGS